MAATETVLASLARLGKTGLEGLETPESRPSEQDSALFSALLEESGGGKPAPKDEQTKQRAEEDGNVLPVLPVAMPVPPPVPQRVPADESATDTKLEEFAVGLGIDRSLARLLLTETAGAPPVDTSIAPVSTPDIEGFAATFAAAVPSVITNDSNTAIGIQPMKASEESTDAVSTEISTPAKPTLLAADFAASLLAAVRPANVDAVIETPEPIVEGDTPRVRGASLTQLDIVRLASGNSEVSSIELAAKSAVSSTPVVTPTIAVAESSPVTAAAVASTPITTPAPVTALPPAVIPTVSSAALKTAPAATAAVEAAPLGDEDVLRWRAMFSRAEPGVRAALSSVTQKAATSEEPVLATVVGDIANKAQDGMMNRSTVAARDTRTERVGGRGGELDGELLAIGSLRNLVLDRVFPTQGVRSLGVDQPAAALTPAVPAANTGFVLVNPAIDPGLSSATTAMGASGGVMNEPLRMPESKLDFATRAEMFADQVAQRVLGQIRSEQYDVNLQLDPRNLGPMDISLRVDGNRVTANVAVNHPEVRGLLESGLPRLRESLESAGLSLTNWSFAQSSSRDPAGTRQRGSSAAGEMSRVARVADEADGGLTVSTVVRGNQAVDLFV
jgi:flagellar hook-length control protein FliK